MYIFYVYAISHIDHESSGQLFLAKDYIQDFLEYHPLQLYSYYRSNSCICIVSAIDKKITFQIQIYLPIKLCHRFLGVYSFLIVSPLRGSHVPFVAFLGLTPLAVVCRPFGAVRLVRGMLSWVVVCLLYLTYNFLSHQHIQNYDDIVQNGSSFQLIGFRHRKECVCRLSIFFVDFSLFNLSLHIILLQAGSVAHGAQYAASVWLAL